MLPEEEKYERFDLGIIFKTYVDFFKSIYDATNVTLNPSLKACFDFNLKFPPSSDWFIAQMVVFLTNIIGYSKTPWQHQRQYIADGCSRYADKLFMLYNNKMAFEVFRHKETIELLYGQIRNQINKQNVRLLNAFERYYYEYCEGSVLNLYYLICFTDSENVKYRNLGKENSRLMYLQLQDIRKFIENSIDTNESDSLIRNKLLWSSLFSEPSTIDYLSEKHKQLGYFPFFIALNFVLSSSENKDFFIFQQCSKIFAEKEMKTLSDIAFKRGLTRERVRQIRVKQFRALRSKIVKLSKTGCLEEYKYNAARDYDLKNIASREEVPFNSNFIVWVVCQIDDRYKLLGNVSEAFFTSSKSTEILYAVPKELCDSFDFKRFIKTIENQLREKRYYEERIELEQYVSRQYKENTDTATFYEIVKACRNILERGFPEIIVNSQLVFQQNARKAVTEIIEDILRKNDAPMTAYEIAAVLERDYPDMKQPLDKVRVNALRNSNIIAISRTSTYTLREWAGVEGKRGGTIRELAEEYLNSLPQPIAQLSVICEYIAKFRTNVKESNVKANLLLEANNKYSLYFKDGLQFIGFTDWKFDDEYVKQDKRQKRLSFSDRIEQLEQFIKNNGRFPYSSNVPVEEVQLNRFYRLSLAYLKDGKLSQEEASEIERITTTYGHLKVKKERVSWEEWLERFVKHITENNTLPRRSSPEYAWYEENKALFDAGQLTPDQTSSFAFLKKIISRMT